MRYILYRCRPCQTRQRCELRELTVTCLRCGSVMRRPTWMPDDWLAQDGTE